tara:strand:+ start:262 stop:1263 length:1002 start_codon:yes stop_codon:yes gene_type:complete
MGIKNLYKLISEYAPQSITNKKLSSYKNKILVIDVSLVIYQYVIAIRNTGDDLRNNEGEMITHILGVINKTIMLLKNKILPIYVFDGKAPKIKSVTLKNRKVIKEKFIKKLEDCDYKTEEDRIKYFKKCYTITKEHKLQIQEILKLFGIPFFESVNEADSLCAWLVKNKFGYGVSSEDMDLLTFNSDILIRGLSSKKKVIEINLKKILEELELSHNQFIDLCILLGSDYCPTIPRVGYKRAFDIIKKYKSIEVFLESESTKYNIPKNFNYKETRDYFISESLKDYNLDSNDVKMLKPDVNNINNLLINKYNISEANTKKYLNVLKNFYDSSCE